MLTSQDVGDLVQAAATAAQSDTMAIAVVDRLGRILAVYKGMSAPAQVAGNFGDMVLPEELAVSLARTGAFFSSNESPLSSRTVRFISGIHFPPSVENAPNGALYGIENTNRGCTLSPSISLGPFPLIPPAGMINGSTPGLGVATGKADKMDMVMNGTVVNPGGVPIFKNQVMVGGIGVVGVDPLTAEYAAFTATEMTGSDGAVFGPVVPPPGQVVIDGVALPFVDQTTPPAGTVPGTFSATHYMPMHMPSNSIGQPPSGFLIPAMDGVGGLTAAQVTTIINNAVSTAMVTRALIRLPIGVRAKMSIAVSDLDGNIIGLYRMEDGTVFSIDVAVAKARNVVYFSGATRQPQDLNGVPIGTAVTNRTIGFGAQSLFPPGINGTPPGPFFNLYEQDTDFPCTQGFQTPGTWPAMNQSGVVFFPGSEPLYINGVLVGGLGVSGDGVDQDDYVTAGGAAGFEPDPSIRADQITIDGVRLPYLHFPRNPTQ
jgi:uncharacterized protein GlcG (DUF336 family)